MENAYREPLRHFCVTLLNIFVCIDEQDRLSKILYEMQIIWKMRIENHWDIFVLRSSIFLFVSMNKIDYHKIVSFSMKSCIHINDV